jgi:hypothetical protein
LSKITVPTTAPSKPTADTVTTGQTQGFQDQSFRGTWVGVGVDEGVDDGGHRGHEPPQSTPLSSPFLIRSVQVVQSLHVGFEMHVGSNHFPKLQISPLDDAWYPSSQVKEQLDPCKRFEQFFTTECAIAGGFAHPFGLQVGRLTHSPDEQRVLGKEGTYPSIQETSQTLPFVYPAQTLMILEAFSIEGAFRQKGRHSGRSTHTPFLQDAEIPEGLKPLKHFMVQN